MRIINAIKSLSKKTKLALTAVIVVATITLPIATQAGYGPNGSDRKIFDFSNPAEREGAFDGPRFNSYINTNVYGDERAFLDAKECVVPGPQCYSQGQAGGYNDQQPVQIGKEYIVRAYVHNIANPSINASGLGVAKNTRLSLEIPEGIANGFTLNANIHADNALPKDVYDTVDLKSNGSAFDVEYVPDSAYISNASHPGGLKLGNDIVSPGGTLLGDKVLNGDFPGCFEYAAFVTVRVKITAPKLEVIKRVTTPGSTDWSEKINVKKGDTVSWLIDYKISDAVAEDVTIRDTLPAGVTLVPGSITWFNPTNMNGQALPDTALGAGGANVGDYAAGSGGAIRFRTTVNKELDKCTLVNVAYGRATSVPEVSDDASVVVDDCVTPESEYRCDLLKAEPVKDKVRTYKFTTITSQTNATVRRYFYNFGDNTQEHVTDKNEVEHVYSATAGNGPFAASVKVEFAVNGTAQTPVTSKECATQISFPTTPVVTTTVTTTPTTMPKTGPADVMGLFAATSAGGAFVHRYILSRRNRY